MGVARSTLFSSHPRECQPDASNSNTHCAMSSELMQTDVAMSYPFGEQVSDSLVQKLAEYGISVLQQNLLELGVEHEADIEYLTEEDIHKEGFKLVHQNKLKEIRRHMILNQSKYSVGTSATTSCLTAAPGDDETTFSQQLAYLRIGALEQKLLELGVEKAADLRFLSQEELVNEGFKLVERKKLNEMLDFSCPPAQCITSSSTCNDAITSSVDFNKNIQQSVTEASYYHYVQKVESHHQKSEMCIEMFSYAACQQSESALQIQELWTSLDDLPNLQNLQKLWKLGEGCYGCVWLERDRVSGIQVAVKEMFWRSEQQRQVANREVDVHGLLRDHPHPFIVRSFAAEFANCSCRLMLEHCVSGTLWDKVREQWSTGNCRLPKSRCLSRVVHDSVRFTPPSSARQWIAQVFLALEYLHLGMEILVRDVKLENVLLDHRNCAKLTDFGCSSVAPVSLPPWTFNCPPGTPGCVAPEVLREEAHDYLADLYSFMILVWMLLTGGIVGDLTNPEPRAPTRYCKDNPNQCLGDFRLFQKYLRYPDDNSVARAPNDALSLLWGLAQEKPLRMRHSDLRQQDLLKKMNLPLPCANPSQIDEWLAGQYGEPSSHSTASNTLQGLIPSGSLGANGTDSIAVETPIFNCADEGS